MLANPLAIASASLGRHQSHTLPEKIRSAAQHGIRGLEITYTDLEAYAESQSIGMIQAALAMRQFCATTKLYILAFCPFENFEGSKQPLAERLELAKQWLEITRTLGAEHMQVPSSYDRKGVTDHEVIIHELRQLADIAAAHQPVVKIAYENLAWSTHCTLWQEAAQIVKDVDRQNFGLCLDSFHIAAVVWGDPYSKSGRQQGGDQRLAESLIQFVRDCPRDKLFYIQLSDGEAMDPPYSKKQPWYEPSLEVGHVWSNEARPFPLEHELEAYMPVVAITQAMIIDTGYKGWVSLEIFDRRMRSAAQGPELNAKRAAKSWQRLSDACGSHTSRTHL